VSGSIDIDEGYAAAHVLAGSAIFAAEQYSVSAAVVIDDRETISCVTTRGVEKGIEHVTVVGDLHALEGRLHETPRYVECLFQFLVAGRHAWVAVGQVDERTAIKIGGAHVKLMSRHLTVIFFESGREFFVFLRNLGPFRVPALQIKKLDPASHPANIGIWMIGRHLHPDLQLSAARESARWIKRFFHAFSTEHVAASFLGHCDPPSDLKADRSFPCLRTGENSTRFKGGGEDVLQMQ
jgi:hypothetical protein